MSDFRKVYHVAAEAGIDSTIEETVEIAREHVRAVADWINRDFPDIFEAVVDETNATVTYLYVYFKGTREGIYLQQGSGTNVNIRNANCFVGTVRDGTMRMQVINGVNVCLSTGNVKLLVVKSKHGVIAGFYTDAVGNFIQALAVNMGTYFIPVLLVAANQFYVASGSGTTSVTTLTASGHSDNVCLVRFLPPFSDEEPEGVYWNIGSSTTDCVIFGVGDGNERYCELQGIANYNTVALKLEEATESDYAGIRGIWNLE